MTLVTVTENHILDLESYFSNDFAYILGNSKNDLEQTF